MSEVEIRIDDSRYVIMGTLVSVESKYREAAPQNGCRTFGPRESVTITVKVDG